MGFDGGDDGGGESQAECPPVPGRRALPSPGRQDGGRHLSQSGRPATACGPGLPHQGPSEEATPGKLNSSDFRQTFLSSLPSLQPAGEDLTGQSHKFHYTADISDRTAGGSFIECEGIQRVEDDILYRVSAKQQVNVVFPPQPADIITVVARSNESLQIDLNIAVSQSPTAATGNNVVWNILQADTSVQVEKSKLS